MPPHPHAVAATARQAKGLNEEETKKTIHAASEAVKKEHMEKAKAWVAQERKARAAADKMKSEAATYPRHIRDIMLARVRIDGLKARPELNGRYGNVATYRPATDGKVGRLAVMVDGEAVLLKMDSLTVVGFDDKPLEGSGGSGADAEEEPPPLM